jgi:hypothetical protein
MNILMYVSFFVCFFSLLLSFIAITRVAQFVKSVHGLDWEAVATLLGDVATVKRSITRLNGRLNGMDNAQPTNFDWQQQAAKVLTEPKQPVNRGG